MHLTYPEWAGDESSYRAAAAVDTLCRPDAPSVWHDLRSADRALQVDGWLAEHRLAELGGEPIGHASFRHLPTAVDGDVVVAQINVLRGHRRRGVGMGLHRLVEEAIRRRGGRHILAFVEGNESPGISFAGSLGYREVGRSIESEIDVENTPLGPVEEVPGISLVELPQLQAADAKWFDRLARLFHAVEADTAFPIDEMPTPRGVLRARLIDAETAVPEAFLVAVDGDGWVGFAAVRGIAGDPTRWSQELTGVLRSHRRRGIARALKQASLQHAGRSGIARVRTWNDSTNAAILAINRQLGFVPRQTIYQMLKSLADRETLERRDPARMRS